MPKRTAIDRRARALQRKVTSTASGSESARPPKWIKPQFTRLVDEAPAGKEWLHEIKYDRYRMHARLADGKAQLLTRTGLDWSKQYQFTIDALQSLPVKSAYLDGELCALGANGVPAFSRLQAAMDERRTDGLVFYAFDLLFLDGESVARLPLIERKDRLRALFAREIRGLRFADHVMGDGPRFREHACRLGVEGIVSKRVRLRLRSWHSQPMAQVQMPKPRRIHRHWLDRSRRQPIAFRRSASWLLHRGRPAATTQGVQDPGSTKGSSRD